MSTSDYLAPRHRVVFKGGPKDGDSLLLELRDIPKVYKCVPFLEQPAVPCVREPPIEPQLSDILNYIRIEWRDPVMGTRWFEYILEEQLNDR